MRFEVGEAVEVIDGGKKAAGYVESIQLAAEKIDVRIVQKGSPNNGRIVAFPEKEVFEEGELPDETTIDTAAHQANETANEKLSQRVDDLAASVSSHTEVLSKLTDDLEAAGETVKHLIAKIEALEAKQAPPSDAPPTAASA